MLACNGLTLLVLQKFRFVLSSGFLRGSGAFPNHSRSLIQGDCYSSTDSSLSEQNPPLVRSYHRQHHKLNGGAAKANLPT